MFIGYPIDNCFNQDLLTKGADIASLVKSFREGYSLYDLRHWIWQLGEAMITHKELFGEGSERENALRFLRDLEEFIEICYLNKLK
jgi:hypothetical protein